MSNLNQLYRHSLALLTDLYQLTMGYGYWKHGLESREAVFQLTFRQNPFEGGYSIACGLGYVIDAISEFRFSADDVAFLATLRGADQERLFDPEFLDLLARLELNCDIDAIPEGTVVFPHEPLIRVRGPLLQAQLVESLLLNLMNFQTLVATKAARVCLAAEGEPVFDFGLRRAQGIDGGITASRAAYVGGCSGTSNVLAGKLFGIPLKGTHAHSWVMAFDSEKQSFSAYADALPNNCLFLIDTYDTSRGLQRAIEVGRRLRERGHALLGVRLDSGDLATLSIEARRVLDESGFSDAKVVASNDLDEYAIAALKEAGARIDIWGVGTRLITAFDQPALGGVYKLSAIRDVRTGEWEPKIKLSQQSLKTSNPGIQQVRRYQMNGRFVGDLLFDEQSGVSRAAAAVNLSDDSAWPIPHDATCEELLVPVFRRGRQVYDLPSLQASRERAREQLDSLSPELRQLRSGPEYTVAIDRQLHRLKERLIAEARGGA